MKIDNIEIGAGHKPFVIAELSANHRGNIEHAIRIIDTAKESGASAVKLQTYTPDTITLKSDKADFKIQGGLWHGRTLYDLYEEAHTPWEWHETLFSHARKIGITIFSSPFDTTAVDLLEDLNTPAYKIASFEIVDIPLIKYVASTGKPIIMSTGMADFQEISEGIEAARSGGATDIALLHCVSGYPAPPEDYNLFTIPDMINKFDVPVGISDHTLDNATAIASISLGASIVEKHVTLDRAGGGPDDSFSLEPSDLKNLCESTYTAWKSLGKVNYERKSSEKDNVKFRRSLYITKHINKGEAITEDAIRSVRPGYGIPPKHIEDVIGKIANRDIESNTALSWEMISKDTSK